MTDETKTLPVSIEELQKNLTLDFHNVALLEQAMTHRSYIHEVEHEVADNERLEFLGDAVLNFLSGDMLYSRFPDRAEGWLTRLRAALVRTESLRELALECELGDALRMGKGEENSGGRARKTNLCAAFEALVGALYLDQGIEVVREFVIPLLEMRLDRVIEEASYQDARTLLQEWSQAERGITPTYNIINESGPDHEKEYEAEVIIDDDVTGRGVGRSKRAAAQSAARDALQSIQVDDTDQNNPDAAQQQSGL
ncbi:MAG: ribonuclease III [Chloroflexota bacterium]